MAELPYTTILLDLDHTLFDFDASERAAFALMVQGCDLDDAAGAFDQYKAINSALWKLVEQGEILPRDVRDRRTAEFCEQLDLSSDRDQMTNVFVEGLGACGELYPGARELLHELDSIATLGMATNGISSVQRAKIARLELGRFFDAIVISDEVGVAKPDPVFFDVLLGELGDPPRESVLMVGDSLNSDMKGGAAAGVATCWFNPSGGVNRTGVRPTHELADLTALGALL